MASRCAVEAQGLVHGRDGLFDSLDGSVVLMLVNKSIDVD